MNDATGNPKTYLDEAAGDAAGAAGASVRRLQVVRTGLHHFGIPIENISTITAWREPTPLPFAPPSVLGVVSIEGRMLTVMDLRRLTAPEAEAIDAASEHIVALRGDEQLALAVEEIGETIELNSAELNAPQQVSSSVVAGVFHHDKTTIHLLNLKELFPAAIQGRERRRRRF
jgi:purine-binding chemotaxis protein CheW